MCDCIKQIDAELAYKNTRLCVVFTIGKNSKVYPQIATEKIDKKSRVKPVTMIPSYCPFCGKKYERK